MNSAVGFTAVKHGADDQVARAKSAHERALAYFPDLRAASWQVGPTQIFLWGRGNAEDWVCRLADGALLALVGSPEGKHSWESVREGLNRLDRIEDFRIPWDGRSVLLHISPDGERWTFWNDWLGSLPVYYSGTAQRRIASTLEPAVVEANRYTQADFFLPGMVMLLIHGHLFSDWTLFKEMKVLQPDSLSTWDEDGLRARACDSMRAGDSRWQSGWRDLVDEMHALSKKAVLKALAGQDEWIVPLSSGLDSRLIAAVGAEAGCRLRAYTWGASRDRETIYSKEIAQALGLPWKQVELGGKYLEQHAGQWAAMFGSSMHFHGMYQFPFMDWLRSEPRAKIVSGFLGDALAGYAVQFHSAYYEQHRRTAYLLTDEWAFWNEQELKDLFLFPIDDALEQIKSEIARLIESYSGDWFQRLLFLTLWGRQRHFTYFQSALCDYWFGVATPFLNREYARFALSLPRAVLEDRRLQVDMMRQYYPKVMAVAGSYARDPAIMSGSYYLKRKVSRSLPGFLSRRLLPEFIREKKGQADVLSLRLSGVDAIHPVTEARGELGAYFQTGILDQVYQNALNGDSVSLRKLQSVQALAYRMMKQQDE